MILTRTGVTLAKHMWPPVTAHGPVSRQFRYTLTWSAITDLVYPKRGIFGLSKGDKLDHFLGTWQEIYSSNMDKYFMEAGVSEDRYAFHMSHKWVVRYTRDGKKWTCYFGILGRKGAQVLPFEMGKPFTSIFVNGQPMTGVIRRDGNTMKEKYETTTAPKRTVLVQRRIEAENLMYIKQRLNNVGVIRKFRRFTGIPTFHAMYL